MKKILAIVVVFLMFNSCNNLDLVPLDKLPADQYYKTAAEFDGAVFAAYSSIQDFWGTSSETLGELGEYWKITDVINDDVKAEPGSWDGTSRDIDNLNIRASDKPFGAIYTQIYEGIYRCNIVLEKIELKNELTPGEKKLYEGETRFLRAFFHFEALKLWGTPPLVIETFKSLSILSVPNASKDALYAQILADFGVAFTNLPPAWDGGNTGRATKWAARAYIGKVNIWKNDMDAAIVAFEDVIANGVGAAGKYGLIDTNNPAKDLEDVFALIMRTIRSRFLKYSLVGHILMTTSGYLTTPTPKVSKPHKAQAGPGSGMPEILTPQKVPQAENLVFGHPLQIL